MLSKDMFSQLKVKDLKKMVSTYRQHHNIRGYSKMKKEQLVSELEKRFILHNNQLFLRSYTEVKSSPPYSIVKTKKRITPLLMNPLSLESSSVLNNLEYPQQSNAVKRVLKKTNEMESYFKNTSKDEYPEYAFHLR